jgi:hypothetical protein
MRKDEPRILQDRMWIVTIRVDLRAMPDDIPNPRLTVPVLGFSALPDVSERATLCLKP